MTPEERWQLIEEKHLSLALSVESLTHDMAESGKKWERIAEEHERMIKEQKRLDARERKAREALLSGIAAYLRALGDDGEENSPNDQDQKA